MSENLYCYIIKSTNPKFINCTYNGYTNNLKKRLRQHNGEIKGGAIYTSNKGPWCYIMIMTGFSNKNEAMSCEWRIKHPTNTKLRPKKYTGCIGRIKSLNEIIKLNNWTNKSDGLINNNNYYLYIQDEYIDLIDPINIKKNLFLNKLSEFNYNYTNIVL